MRARDAAKSGQWASGGGGERFERARERRLREMAWQQRPQRDAPSRGPPRSKAPKCRACKTWRPRWIGEKCLQGGLLGLFSPQKYCINHCEKRCALATAAPLFGASLAHALPSHIAPFPPPSTLWVAPIHRTRSRGASPSQSLNRAHTWQSCFAPCSRSVFHTPLAHHAFPSPPARPRRLL